MQVTVFAEGFAHWAGYLINNDPDGLSWEDVEACHRWLRTSGVDASDCMSCTETAHIGQLNGIQGEMLTYTFLCHK